MLGAARTAWYSRVWVPPNARRTTAAATLSTFTFSGINGANYTTAKAQFGAGSLDATGAGQSITYSNWSGPYPSGTGDFCVEGWVWVPSTRDMSKSGIAIVNNEPGNTPVPGPFAPGGLGIRFGIDGSSSAGNFNHLSVFARAEANMDYAAITWPTDTWVHWAVQRKSAVMSFRANGNKLAITGGSGGGTYNFAAPSNVDLSIGDYDSGGSPIFGEIMRCYMDEMCVSDSWRYDDAYSTYIVPTLPFTVDTITDMLIHFDSSLTTAAT